jgi:predicted nucleotidyltransferase
MADPTLPPVHPAADAVLAALVSGARAILGDRMVGIYLYGSLTYGSFDRESDVDFLVVSRESLSEAALADLQEMHARLARLGDWCATQLDGSYTPRLALRQYDPQRALHYHIDRGPGERLTRMQLDDADSRRAWWGGWVMLRSNLYQSGIALAGPGPRELVDPVSPAELRAAARALLQGWAVPILREPERMDSRGYQSYIVLTMCRMLRTLRRGDRLSKPAAVRWARRSLDSRWLTLIEHAWAGRQDSHGWIDPGDVQGTLDMIRYVLEEAGVDGNDAPLPY